MVVHTYLDLILCEVPKTIDGFKLDLLLQNAAHSIHVLAKLDTILWHDRWDIVPIATLMIYLLPHEMVINFFSP